MGSAVYNSGIPQNFMKSMNRAAGSGSPFCSAILIALGLFACTICSPAADWNSPEQELARKLVAIMGPGSAALVFENRSSLGRRDADIIENGLRSALEQTGIRFVENEQAATNITIFLSENATSYVWVANIRQSALDAAVVMVAVPRPGGPIPAYDSMPLSLRKTMIWTQKDRILDVAVLEESQTATRMAILDAKKLSLYQMQGGKWQEEQTLEITHTRPWPRDLRGRLIVKDHLLEAYLPGVICRSTAGVPLALNCRDSEDPWPLVPTGMNTASVLPNAGSTSSGTASITPTSAFFAPTRNFFTGVVAPSIGKISSVPKFYSAAPLPRGKYTLWLFSAADGNIHVVDGIRDQISKFGWRGDVTTLKTSCGAGWQILATTFTETGGDAVRAYEMPDRDPIPVSASVDFSGTLTTIWTEASAETAIAVMRDQQTGNYEAFRLAVACNQ